MKTTKFECTKENFEYVCEQAEKTLKQTVDDEIKRVSVWIHEKAKTAGFVFNTEGNVGEIITCSDGSKYKILAVIEK